MTSRQEVERLKDEVARLSKRIAELEVVTACEDEATAIVRRLSDEFALGSAVVASFERTRPYVRGRCLSPPWVVEMDTETVIFSPSLGRVTISCQRG